MLRIRLRRVGKRKHASYRVVVCDQRTQRDGAFIENLGSYEPHANPPLATLNEASAKEWLSKGASPSEAVEKIFRRSGIIEGGPVKRRQVAAEAPAAETPAAETPAAETPVAEAASEEAPVTEAPAEEAASEDAPVAESPAEDAAAAEEPDAGADSSTEEE